MKHTRLLITLAMVLTPLTLVAVLQTVGADMLHAKGPDRAPVVAVVDLGRLLNGLDIVREGNEELQARQVMIDEESRLASEKLDKLRSNIEALPENSSAREEAQAEYELQGLTLQAKRTYELEKLRRDDSLLLQEIYTEIRAAIKTYSEANGIDIVFRDSSPSDFPRDSENRILNAQQTGQLMTSWQTIYVNPQFDITDDLIAFMNSQAVSP
ncbi:MAG: OmpH family outer membrane protein [Phycisphaerales bacterium]|nr:OmpH family outer membrane protein [Phycisphaerales bacterium]